MKDDGYRVFRGGSWFNSPQSARIAGRNGLIPGFRLHYLGIRLARDPIHTLTKAATDEV